MRSHTANGAWKEYLAEVIKWDKVSMKEQEMTELPIWCTDVHCNMPLCDMGMLVYVEKNTSHTFVREKKPFCFSKVLYRHHFYDFSNKIFWNVLHFPARGRVLASIFVTATFPWCICLFFTFESIVLSIFWKVKIKAIQSLRPKQKDKNCC